MLDELHRVVFGKKIYRSIHELQIDLDARIIECNVGRTHQGAGTNLGATLLAREKILPDQAAAENTAAA